MRHSILILLILLISSTIGLLLETPDGFLLGAETKYRDQVIHMFKHVPFAAPPIGNLRFQLLQKVQPWKDVRNATVYGPACLSNTALTTSPQKWISEDCLHTNIFASEKCIKSGSCPVIVYFHGGRLLYDSAVMYDDDKIIENFASEDVVFVISAMRLGFFGLLTFEDDEMVPRNLVFYDMKTSLEWVQDSISIFGGNPDDVTLFGHSAGCSAAILMTYSKTFDPNLKLFHKVMCMSPMYAFEDTTQRLAMSWKFAEKAGCASDKQNPSNYMIRNVVECLQTKNSMELLRIQRELEDVDNMIPNNAVHLQPLFHGETWTEFIDQPNNTRRKIFLGVNTKELRPTNESKAEFILDYLGYSNPLITGRKFDDDMKNGYFGNDLSIETVAAFAHLIQILNSYTRAGGEAYLYQFRFPKQAHHTEDLFYIMGVHPFEMDENERALSIIYPKMFTDFVKTGKPGDAIQYNSLYRNYYNINFNISDGTRPHNSIGFEKKIMDYFTKNLTEYDNEVSIHRQQNKIKQSSSKSIMSTLNGLPSVENSFTHLEFDSLIKDVLVTVLFTLVGVAVGWRLRDRKLNRRTYDNGEKTPLLI